MTLHWTPSALKDPNPQPVYGIIGDSGWWYGNNESPLFFSTKEGAEFALAALNNPLAHVELVPEDVISWTNKDGRIISHHIAAWMNP